jgi:hypothetical protein
MQIVTRELADKAAGFYPVDVAFVGYRLLLSRDNGRRCNLKLFMMALLRCLSHLAAAV